MSLVWDHSAGTVKHNLQVISTKHWELRPSKGDQYIYIVMDVYALCAKVGENSAKWFQCTISLKTQINMF